MLKQCLVAAGIAALTLSSAAADGLAPGKPANVKKAQMMPTDTLLGLGLAAVAVGVVIGVSSGSGNNGTVSTASTTSTS